MTGPGGGLADVPVWAGWAFGAVTVLGVALAVWWRFSDKRAARWRGEPSRDRADKVIFTVAATGQARSYELDLRNPGPEWEREVAEQDVAHGRAQPQTWTVTVENQSGSTIRDLHVGRIPTGGERKVGLAYRDALNPGATWESDPLDTTTRLDATWTDDDGDQWERADLATDSTLTYLAPASRPSRRVAFWRR